MTFLKAVFWISFFLVFYTYLGYGILLFIIVSIKKLFTGKKDTGSQPVEPPVSLIVSAFNEGDFIETKIVNTLQLDYPEDKLDILFITDGSYDNTPSIVRNYNRIRLLHEPERKGKAAAMNRAVNYVKTPIVIFCDANTLLNKNCIREITKHYDDPKVGGVAGEKVIFSSGKGKAAAAGEGLYWKYESALKKLDAELYSVVGAAGELFSVRTALYEPVKEGTIIEDFVLSLRICIRGYVIKYEPNAYAMETGSASMREEQKRKVRISAGAFQAMSQVWELFNIFKFPILSFQFISHRILRWTLCPLCLLLLFISNILIVIKDGGVFYTVILAIQILFYFLAVIGWIFANRNIQVKALYVPYYFFFMNVSVFLGFNRFISRRQSVLWEKSSRQKFPHQHIN
jgi:cellulose synthase/poly-beta-1,6-N-acetylglucosamine synthase-like glycosyltransferase